MIKDVFASYVLRTADITFDLRANSLHVHATSVEPWHVTLVDMADDSFTGGRLEVSPGTCPPRSRSVRLTVTESATWTYRV